MKINNLTYRGLVKDEFDEKKDGKIWAEGFPKYDKLLNQWFVVEDIHGKARFKNPAYYSTLCECTGVHDMYDRRIYEGDIIKLDPREQDFDGTYLPAEYYIVEWDILEVGFYLVRQLPTPCAIRLSWTIDQGWMEIVGNVWEQPELAAQIMGDDYHADINDEGDREEEAADGDE